MKLYRTAKGTWVGTQAEARAEGKGWKPVEVPTNKKADLLDFLNTAAPAEESPAYRQGRSDAERGITTNPYTSGDLKAEWERGHYDTYEAGLSDLTSFARRALPRFEPARTREINRRRAEARKAA